jgi:probable RNA-binding protein EIF1AD
MFFIGDYVLVEDIQEGDKVKAEIVQILLKDNIKYIRSQNCW